MTDAVHDWPLGERLQRARGEESQRSVAARADISPEMLWQLENGRRRDGKVLKRPSADLIMRVARAVDVPVAEALRLAGYKPEHHLEPAADGIEAQLARKVAKLQPEVQRAVEIIVDSLLRDAGYVAGQPAVDVMVRSAGQEVRPGVRSHGQTAASDDARQPHED